MTFQPAAGVATRTQRPRESFGDPARGDASWFTQFSADITPTRDMSAGLMEIPPRGGRLDPHRRRQAEIYFVHSGAGVLTVDGVDHALVTGCAADIRGDAEHAPGNDGDEVLRIFYVFPADRFAEIEYRFGEATHKL